MASSREQFGRSLRRLRLTKGISSAAALARKAGISMSHVSMFERGEFLPRWTTARKLADALQLDPQERAEFYAAIDSARQPEDVKEALANIPQSGIAAAM